MESITNTKLKAVAEENLKNEIEEEVNEEIEEIETEIRVKAGVELTNIEKREELSMETRSKPPKNALSLRPIRPKEYHNMRVPKNQMDMERTQSMRPMATTPYNYMNYPYYNPMMYYRPPMPQYMPPYMPQYMPPYIPQNIPPPQTCPMRQNMSSTGENKKFVVKELKGSLNGLEGIANRLKQK